MTIKSGTHQIGPENGSLTVSTYVGGMGSKMGHDLVLEATSWSGKVQIAENALASTAQVTVDVRSLQVVKATGGLKPLSDKDKADIKKSISDKVLGSSQITFQSTEVTDSAAKGELSIAGSSSSVDVPLNISGDKISGSISLSQSDFGIKQFKALMGTLKVTDQVTVEFEGTL